MDGVLREGLNRHLDDLKKVFTSNYAGTMGHAGNKMNLTQIKQQQGETLRSYMCRFFDRRYGRRRH